jgi:4-alpha-glucanotransferase
MQSPSWLVRSLGCRPRVDSSTSTHDVPNTVLYTGTHDNDTVVGWWKLQASDSNVRAFCKKYLKTDGREIHWDLIRAAWSSVADVAIAPLQDILGLDNEARMNLPASTSGNWQWRFCEGALNEEIENRLRDLTEVYGRGGE